MEGFSQEFLTDQWNTYEIALTPDQAKSLGHVKGIYLLRNQGGDWRGPIYIDDLRAVVPTTPANGGTTTGGTTGAGTANGGTAGGTSKP